MRTYRFGGFELDVEAQQLLLRGTPVHLERRPFDLLCLLVREPGRLHTRDEIIAALWPARAVIDFDAGLNTVVRKVRHALGNSSDEPRYIETVPGRGYRFIAPVMEVTARPVVAPVAPSPANEDRAIETASGLRRYLPVIAVILALAVAVTAWRFIDVEPAPTRIAVLPFDNLTDDQDLAYLASGLAHETSASLARIDLPNLSVIGIVSARAMKNSGLPLPEIARQFGVDFVVDSSISLEDSHIRVTSQLVRTSDGEQLWSASFDRQLTNAQGIQRELSIAIAEQVRQKLSPDVIARIDRRQTENPEAYALYLKGREQWTHFRPTMIDDALAFYDRAVEIDPEYGLAWAGIAHASTTATLTADAPPDVAVPRARHALDQALQFGPDLAETWVAQGTYSQFIEWDYPAAETATHRAVALDPNNAMAHMTLAMTLSAQHRHIEARAAMRRARELDPLFPLMFANSAYIERAAGNPEASIEFTRQAIAMEPDFWASYWQLGLTLREQSDYVGALAAFEAADKYSGRNANTVAFRAYTLACLGRDDEAVELRDLLVTRRAERYVAPYAIAYAEAGLGNTESAIEWMKRAIEERDINLTSVFRRSASELATDDPQFAWLHHRCGPMTASTG